VTNKPIEEIASEILGIMRNYEPLAEDTENKEEG